MKFEKLLKALAPVAIMAIAGGLAACDGARMTFNGDEGVPLAELDLSGDPPSELVLAGPDTVVVTDGARLDIDVEGDTAAVEALRFTLSDGTLGILREAEVTIAGSGRLDGRADGPVSAPPRARAEGPAEVWSGDGFTLSALASEAAARRKIERFIWMWDKES